MIDKYKSYAYIVIAILILIIVILVIILLSKLGKLMKKTALLSSEIDNTRIKYDDINKKINKKNENDNNKTLRYLSSALLIINVAKETMDNFKKEQGQTRKLQKSFKKACLNNKDALKRIKF